MSCSRPLKGFKYGYTKNGKDNLLICSFDTVGIDVRTGKKYKKGEVPPDALGYMNYEYTEIPCGKCVSCRLEYSRQWANRCLLEMKEHDSNYFITLTYDDDHIHFNDDGIGTLCKTDLQKFFKRLRKQTGQQIRYFACGEYGDNTKRPHYHAIIFGLKLDDLVPFGNNMNVQYQYFTSPTLTKIWKNGHVCVGEASWETAAYTARYVMKKLNGDESVLYDYLGIEKEFVLMSRKPGIARNYYDKLVNSDDGDNVCYANFLNISENGKKFKKPKYFDRLFDIEYPVLSAEIKESQKKFIESTKRLKMAQTSLPYEEMLKVEEKAKLDKAKMLIRKEF